MYDATRTQMNWWHRFVRNQNKSEPADEATCAAALGRIIEHRASTLTPRKRLAEHELDALDDDERRAYQQRAVDEQKALGDVDALMRDIQTVGLARYEQAVPALAALWEECPASSAALEAGRALSVIGSAAAHDSLQKRLGDSEMFVGNLVISSLLEDPRAGYDAFARLAERAERSDAVARRAVVDVLYRFTNDLGRRQVKAREPSTAEATLEQEPRWLDLAARLRRGPCERAACALLDKFPADVVGGLVARHPLPPTAAPHTKVAAFHPHPADANASDDVLWQRLVEIGPVDGELRAAALDVAMRRLAPVARNADRITARLVELGWPVREDARRRADAPSRAEPNPFTGESTTGRIANDERARGDLDAQIAVMERSVGTRLPVVLEAFWRVVGTIDWAPRPDERLPDWAREVGIERIDPLCVENLETAWHCVSEWLDGRTRRKHAELEGPPRVWIAPDRFHKMGISGGAPYEIEIDGSFDPPVLKTPETLRLLPYIRHAMRWGGLPGIAKRKQVSARVERVLAGLTADLEPA